MSRKVYANINDPCEDYIEMVPTEQSSSTVPHESGQAHIQQPAQQILYRDVPRISKKWKMIIFGIAVILLAALGLGIACLILQVSQEPAGNLNHICGAFPLAPPNAGVVNSPTEVSPGSGTYRSASFVSYQCNASYFPMAAVTITCQTNGTWETLNLKCQRVCGTFPLPPPNAVVWNAPTEISPGSGTYRSGSFVSYQCNASYLPMAAVTITCQTNGTWETLNLKCQRVDRGWYTPGNGYRYFLTNMTQNWTESRQICQEKGGDLASVGMRNSTIRDKLWNAFLNGKRTWIGLNDIKEEGNWKWADGAAYVRNNTLWKSGQPSNFGGIEDCGEVGWAGSREINDDKCYEEKFALCGKRL